ncbi:type IV pilus assembly protein PilM [Candidatus Nomurabacteria bacterium]|nr:type IV pilus assembly protein PilM [Candidatus Nomurabacteria bacterium]USN94504.1 MAG: type IV pilus assembly protein PilM [Candidatus Nomurabacteria bacterium]
MDNPLNKIFSLGKAAFSKPKEESAVGIDIGSSSIKVVQIKKKKGKALLETYGTLSLGPYASAEVGKLTNLPEEALSKALADVIRESGVTTKRAGLAVPSSASLIFVLSLPKTIGEKELRPVIETEARKYIPVSISEVALDFWQIPEREAERGDSEFVDSGAKQDILVAAIHNETLEKYSNVAKTANISPELLEIEVFSAIRSSLNHELSTVLLVDIGAMKSKLTIVEYGIVRLFHVINRGSHDITNSISTSLSMNFESAEKAKRDIGLTGIGEDRKVSDVAKISIDYIFSEVNTVITTYERKYQRPISKIIFVGAGSLLKGLDQYAKAVFKSDIELGAAFDKVESPAFLKDVLKEAGPEFAVATGLALRILE